MAWTTLCACRYPGDGDQEHVLWPELAKLLKKSEQWGRKKRKNGPPAGTAGSEGRHHNCNAHGADIISV
jgi:hypothetical protein